MRRPRSRLDRDHFFRNPGVTISHHRALRRKILTTVMGAPHGDVQILPERNSDRGDIMPANISTRLGGSILVLVLASCCSRNHRPLPKRSGMNCFPSRMCGRPQPTAQRQPTSSTRRSTNSGSARRDTIFRDRTANNGDRVKLPLDIGRPSLTENYHAQAVTGSTQVNAYLPVIWFIEPAIGAVQFCAVPTQGRTSGLRCPDRTHRKGRPCRRCY